MRKFTDNDSFSYDKGLNIVVALTFDDNNPEPIDDPTIGQVVFNHYNWGRHSDGTRFSDRFPINSYTCSREELGLDGDNNKARFYPIKDNLIDFHHRNFLCLNKEDIEVFGDFSSAKA